MGIQEGPHHASLSLSGDWSFRYCSAWTYSLPRPHALGDEDDYRFAGLILMLFSPYSRLLTDQPLPPLPFDVSTMVDHGIEVPEEIRNATGYREFLGRLRAYAREGLREMRGVNPITRDTPWEQVTRHH